jgi:hypothetical protein
VVHLEPSLLIFPDNYGGYETSYTSYGAGGGGGGGGFIPGEGGSTQSPGGRQDRAQDTLRPVTIKQILDAQLEAGSNDAFKIDGAVVTQVSNSSMVNIFMLTSPAHICRPNTQHIQPDYKHDVQAR